MLASICSQQVSEFAQDPAAPPVACGPGSAAATPATTVAAAADSAGATADAVATADTAAVAEATATVVVRGAAALWSGGGSGSECRGAATVVAGRPPRGLVHEYRRRCNR